MLVIKKFYIGLLIFLTIFLKVGLSQGVSGNNPAAYNSSLHYRFEHISTDQGLPQSSVVCIMKDSKDFIWFGTYSGLCRYDGKNIKHYFHNPKNPNSLSNNMIWSLANDNQGNIWVGTWGGGLNRYIVKEDRFEYFKNEYNNKASIASDIVRCLLIDKKNRLWIGTETGLSLFNPLTKTFKNFDVHKNPLLHSQNIVLSLYTSEDGILWIGTNSGLVKFDTENLKIIKEFRNISRHSEEITYNAINDIVKDKEGRLWLATWGGGLSCMNTITEEITHYWHNTSNNNSISSNIIMDQAFDKYGRLWLATRGNGIDIFDIENNKFENIHNNEGDHLSLSNNSVYCLYNDDDIIWVGNDFGGVNKYDFNKAYFRSYRTDFSNNNKLKILIPATLYEDSKDYLWIGGVGSFEKYDRAKNRYKAFKFRSQNGHFESVSIRAFQEDFDGTMWIGSDGGGLMHFNPDTEQFVSYNFDETDQHSISQDFIYAIALDKYNNLWIGTQNSGICIYDRENDQFNRILHNPNIENALPENKIKVLFKDSKGNMWVGTDSRGIAQYDYTKRNFISYMINDNQSIFLPENYINVINEDSQGNIWVGTVNNGISFLDKKTGIFKNFNESAGLSNNNVLGILEDNARNLWVSTANGLNKINLKTFEITQYYKDDGLIHHEFQIKSCLKSKTGEFLFGTRGGIVVFYPKDIKINNTAPKIDLIDIKLFYKSLPIGKMEDGRTLLNKSLRYTDSITLNYMDKILTIEFIALSYSSPDKNQYAYKLIGFDDKNEDWTYIKNQNSVTFTNLQPGKYTFIVKAANSDSVWNQQGRSLVIIVKPPFWMTWWFRTSGIFLAGIALFSLIYWRTWSIKRKSVYLEKTVAERTYELKDLNNRLSRNNDLLKERQIRIEQQANELEKQKEELLIQRNSLQIINEELNKSNGTKNKLFSIIAHDLRSPFNIIIGFSELIMNKIDSLDKKKHKEYAQQIMSAARNVYNLLDNLLLWARSQQESIQFKPEWFSVKELIDQNIELLKENAKQKSISIVNNFAAKENIFADRNMVQTVLRNLIGNAIKFSRKKGAIQINSISIDGTIQISVKDFGIGISDESKFKIFTEEGYSTKGPDEEKGTGLGLIICKDFINAHNGKIWFESESEKGTTFHFTLPQ